MPLLPLASDLAFILKDVGSAVVFGGKRTHGKLRREKIEEPTEGGFRVVGYRTTLLVAADDAALATAVVGSTLTIDGTAYKLRDPGVEQPDGMRAYLLAEA